MNELLYIIIGAIVVITPVAFSLYIKSTSTLIAALTSERNSAVSISTRALSLLESEILHRQEREHVTSIPLLADVQPEHNSPVTPHQQLTAQLATLRARLTAAELASVGIDMDSTTE